MSPTTHFVNMTMYAKSHMRLICSKIKPIASVVVVMATLLAPVKTVEAQTGSSTPQVLSRNQQPRNYTVLHVDAANGNDRQGTGETGKPYKTVTHALQRAQPGVSTVILLAPGHYSQASGETFPLHLKPGITIQGNAGEARNTMIVGSGEVHTDDSVQNATIVTADRSGLANVTVANQTGNGVWIAAGSPILRRVALVANSGTGVYVSDGTPIIENSYFNRNHQGLVIQGRSRAVVRGNYFEATGRAITVSSPATPTINNNRIANNNVGIALRNNARPTIEANVLSENQRNGVVEVDPVAAEPSVRAEQPDLLAIRATEVSRTTTETPAVPTQVLREEPSDLPEVESESAESPVSLPPVVNTPQPPLNVAAAPVLGATPVTNERPEDNRAAPGSAAENTSSDRREIISLRTNASSTADEAIPIAVIPATSDEYDANISNERTTGISKLLARLSNPSPAANSNPPSDDNHHLPSQRLPVPTAAIPSRHTSGQLLPPGTRSLAQTFRYRVLVNLNEADNLEALVPDAFRTRVGRRTYMQAGAYVDEAEAQERLEWLEANGIEARINIRD
ncbi:MAG: DUF1565 domain-containing protein [Cyanobacteria bacterium P01_D01_bin.156]